MFAQAQQAVLAAQRPSIPAAVPKGQALVGQCKAERKTDHGQYGHTPRPCVFSNEKTSQVAVQPVPTVPRQSEVQQSDLLRRHSSAQMATIGHRPPAIKAQTKLKFTDSADPGYRYFKTIQASNWELPRYFVEPFTFAGSGSYGQVHLAQDSRRNETVAIKRVKMLYDEFTSDLEYRTKYVSRVEPRLDKDFCRYLWQILVLKQLNHPNLIRLLDVVPPPAVGRPIAFDYLYIVTNSMPTTLQKIVQRPNHDLSQNHAAFITRQLLNGLAYLHGRGIIHRDIKPANILVNEECRTQICDFDLCCNTERPAAALSDYVVTRWYRAPEIMLGCAYTEAIDIWSVGVILLEMLSENGSPWLNNCRNYQAALQQIFMDRGFPSLSLLQEMKASNYAINYFYTEKKLPRHGWAATATGHTCKEWVRWREPAAPNTMHAVDLVERMLEIDPRRRISIADALKHPFLLGYAHLDPTPVGDLSRITLIHVQEPMLTRTVFQETLWQEMMAFHPEMQARYKDWKRTCMPFTAVPLSPHLQAMDIEVSTSGAIIMDLPTRPTTTVSSLAPCNA